MIAPRAAPPPILAASVPFDSGPILVKLSVEISTCCPSEVVNRFKDRLDILNGDTFRRGTNIAATFHQRDHRSFLAVRSGLSPLALFAATYVRLICF